MEEGILPWFRELGDLLSKIEVADAAGTPFAFERGVKDAVRMLSEVGHGNKVIFIGNGAGATIASHQATDYWKNWGIRTLVFNDAALLTCISNDYGYEQVFEKPLQMFAEPGDVLVAISSSGRSPNIIRGVQAARARGCSVITLSGLAADNPLRRLGDLNFYVPSHSYGYVEIIHLAVCHCLGELAARHRPSTSSGHRHRSEDAEADHG